MVIIITMRQTLNIITTIYLAFVLIWFALWLTMWDYFWWMTILNARVTYLAMLAPFLACGAVLTRQYRLALMALTPWLIVSALFWPYWIPRPTLPTASSDFTMMTYNIRFGNHQADRVVEVILTHQPDFVALQEVQPTMMTALTKRLAHQYPYSLMGDEHPYGTTALFSQHPFQTRNILDLQADRPAVVATVLIDEHPVTIISAHLLAYGLRWVSLADIPAVVTQKTFEQNRQAARLLAFIQSQPGIVLLGCDCNSKETSSSYRLLNRIMPNAARTVGWRPNQPIPQNSHADVSNWLHIDYLFYRGPLSPTAVLKIEDSGGSDHLPVMGYFNVNDN